MTSIMTFFTGTPRECQLEALLEMERTWHQYDVFVIRAPVGAGKSRIAHCLASWAHETFSQGSTILTPTNLLVQQYCDEFSDLATLKRINAYPSRAAYESARQALFKSPLKVLNYYSYLAHRAYSPIALVDEAHGLVPFLQDKEAVRLWTHLTPVPEWCWTVDALAAWAAGHDDKKLNKLAKKLAQHPDTYVVERVTEEFRGHDREAIKLLPLTPRSNRPILWPPRTVRKLVFMSATFHAEDLYDLGLDGRRVKVIDCASPIPVEQRPVIYAPVGSLGRAHRSRTMPGLVTAIESLLQRHPERGVIHATYGLAREIRSSLGGHPRLVWHTHSNKDRVYREWLAGAGRDDKVLVACGLSEGIDLAGDRARWQAVTKLMFPDMSDVAVAAKLQLRPTWYAWRAARDLQQQIGRVCRGPTDYGITYILTSEFARLWEEHRSMFPDDFKLQFGRV